MPFSWPTSLPPPVAYSPFCEGGPDLAVFFAASRQDTFSSFLSSVSVLFFFRFSHVPGALKKTPGGVISFFTFSLH